MTFLRWPEWTPPEETFHVCDPRYVGWLPIPIALTPAQIQRTPHKKVVMISVNNTTYVRLAAIYLMWHSNLMEIQRTITIFLPDDADVRATLAAFRAVQNAVSEVAFNGGKPLRAVELQRAVYDQVKGTLSSQMTITALRLVAGAYASAKRNCTRRIHAEARRKARYEAKGWNYTPRHIKPVGVCRFERPTALFLVGERGRDADFRADGTLSIWTVAGRKHIHYTIPPALRPLFEAAKEIDSVTVIERKGKFYGRVALTLEAPEPAGIVPVGIDLNETNAVVAVDADGREFFQSGKATKVRNQRTMQATKRVQRKLAAKKAEGADTHGVRRVLKRLSGRRKRRTHDFACVSARRLIEWAPADAVLVFEDLRIDQPSRESITKTRRGWCKRHRPYAPLPCSACGVHPQTPLSSISTLAHGRSARPTPTCRRPPSCRAGGRIASGRRRYRPGETTRAR